MVEAIQKMKNPPEPYAFLVIFISRMQLNATEKSKQ